MENVFLFSSRLKEKVEKNMGQLKNLNYDQMDFFTRMAHKKKKILKRKQVKIN